MEERIFARIRDYNDYKVSLFTLRFRMYRTEYRYNSGKKSEFGSILICDIFILTTIQGVYPFCIVLLFSDILCF